MPKRERAPEPELGDPSTDTVPRISVPIKDGRIDVDRMRGEKREQLRGLVRNTPGLSDLVATPHGTAATDADAQALALIANMTYQVLGQLATLLAMQTMNVTAEQAQIFLFTEAERVTLTPLTSRVLAKYLPSITTRYADELALAGTLGAMTMQKITALRELQAVKGDTAQQSPEVK